MLRITPIDLRQANVFVGRLHRHHKKVPGAKFCLAATDEQGVVRGVAIVGRPVSRVLDDGWTLEVNRCCTDGARNACSLLYGAAWRAAREIGFRRLITYTLPEEGGASLRAAGWKPTEGVGGSSWNVSRQRASNPHSDNKVKTRWEVSLGVPETPPPKIPSNILEAGQGHFWA
jgi:hypothetical protein